MTQRDPGAPIGSFVALGDSFTEGLNDPYPSGGYRGWADRVAAVLAAQAAGFGYANLAISGKLLGQVIAEQVPRAAEMAPDLVSLAAGGNDILRGADVDALACRFERAVVTLQAAGCQVELTRDGLAIYDLMNVSAFLQDTFTSGRLTAQLGLRYDRNHDQALAANVIANPPVCEYDEA